MKKKELLSGIKKLEDRVLLLEQLVANLLAEKHFHAPSNPEPHKNPWIAPSPITTPTPWTCDGTDSPEVRMSMEEYFHAGGENWVMGDPEDTIQLSDEEP